MQATYVQEGDVLTWTNDTGVAVAVGDIIVIGNLVGRAQTNIAAGADGAVAVCGVFNVAQAAVAFTRGGAVYWHPTGDPVGGTAGTGAATSEAAGNLFMGYALAATEATDATVRVALRSSELTGTVTFPGRLEGGAMATGLEYGADELIEFHGKLASATSGKPMVRFRTDPKQAMTTGTLWALQAQAYGNAEGGNLLAVYGFQAEAGLKAAGTILTGGALVGGRFKVEDLGADGTFAGTAKASALQVWGQFSTGTTFAASYAYNLVEFGLEGNIAADAFFHHSTNIQPTAFIKAFFTTVDAPGSGDAVWLTTKTLTGSTSLALENDAAIRIVVDTDGTPVNYWIPLYNG